MALFPYLQRRGPGWGHSRVEQKLLTRSLVNKLSWNQTKRFRLTAGAGEPTDSFVLMALWCLHMAVRVLAEQG